MTASGIYGTIVPLVTPFDRNGSFDRTTMHRLVEFVMAEGADALMPTALTGEASLLTQSEMLFVWDAVFERARGLLPIIPAVISTTTRAALDLVLEAESRGAPAVMLAPVMPELYSGRAQDEVYGFYSEIAERTRLPFILFNYPSLTGIDFVPALVARLAEVENVQYIKESTGDSRRVHEIRRLLGERVRVICGAPNVALESLALGCEAWITGIMNVVPRSSRQLVRAVTEVKDLALARRIYFNQILPVVDVLSNNRNPTGTIKAGVSARGVHVGVPRKPGSGLNAAERKRVEDTVSDVVRAETAVECELATLHSRVYGANMTTRERK